MCVCARVLLQLKIRVIKSQDVKCSTESIVNNIVVAVYAVRWMDTRLIRGITLEVPYYAVHLKLLLYVNCNF